MSTRLETRFKATIVCHNMGKPARKAADRQMGIARDKAGVEITPIAIEADALCEMGPVILMREEWKIEEEKNA